MRAPGPSVMKGSVVSLYPPLTIWLLAPLVLLCVIPLLTSPALGNPEAKRLYEDLLTHYKRLIRPVGNNSDRLTVKLGLKLSQLIDVVSFVRY